MRPDGTEQEALTEMNGLCDDLCFHPGGNFGDIFAVNTTPARLLRLTDDAAWNGRPQFHPDGKRLLFASNREGATRMYALDFTPYL